MAITFRSLKKPLQKSYVGVKQINLIKSFIVKIFKMLIQLINAIKTRFNNLISSELF